MCDRCRAEYEDPADRRFHAEPNACPDCGPSVRLAGEWPIGRRRIGQLATDPVAAAAAAIDEGAIVAVKGLGGFHLACRADDEDAVARLRARKRREEKPFAVMAADLAAARRLARLGSAEEALLNGRDRPIVLAPRRPGAAVAAAVAPGVGGPRADAPLLPAPPPAARRRRRPAGHDERQRQRRADRPPRRGRARAAGGDRRPVPAPRPPHRHPHRRLGGAAGRRGRRRS